MKALIIVLKVLVIVLLVLDLLFWMAAHASGHKIPLKTDVSCAVFALILIVTLFLLFFIGRKLKNKVK